MKTQLQYPNGLSITIEHDEQFAPQVLEVKEDNNLFDITGNLTKTGLQEKVEYLNRENEQLHKLCEVWENENTVLKTAIEKISTANNNHVATIRELKEEIVELNKRIVSSDAVHAKTAEHDEAIVMANALREKTEHSFKNVTPEKAAPKWAKKPCSKCGKLFQPTGPRSTLCENCKAEKQTEPAE